MNIVGILFLIAAVICIIVVVGSWVLGIITSTFGGAINKAFATWGDPHRVGVVATLARPAPKRYMMFALLRESESK